MQLLYGDTGFDRKDAEIQQDKQDVLIYNATQLLLSRGHYEAAAALTALDFHIYPAENGWGDEFNVLVAPVELSQYEYYRAGLASKEHKKEINGVFKQVQEALVNVDCFVRSIGVELDQAMPATDWESRVTTTLAGLRANQAVFRYKDRSLIRHEQLDFRSKTEIRIYDELVSRGLLVIPLPVAVMGRRCDYLEPDFLVIYKGQIGILEVHGDEHHPPETAAKEHERGRRFRDLGGVSIYQIFDARKGYNNPKQVVDDFLKSFDS